MSHNSKIILIEFIELYRSQPCLWNVKNKEYYNRTKKERAYVKLVEKLKLIEPEADREAVVRKINNLRSNVRKERKKYEASLRQATTASEVYHPTLWYYGLFEFLQETSNGVSIKKVAEGYDQESNNLMEAQEALSNDVEGGKPLGSIDSEWIKSEAFDDQISTYEPPYFQYTNATKRPHHEVIADEKDDRFDLFGKSIAIKMRGLDKRQALLVEKRINDVLFEAEMNNLDIQQNDVNDQ